MVFITYTKGVVSIIYSISVTWELLRNADSWTLPRSTESETLWVEPSGLCFNKFSR